MGRQKGFQISDFRFQIRDSRFEILGFEIRDLGFEIWDLGFFCGAWERLHILRTAYRLLEAGRLHLRFLTHSVEDSQRNYHDSNHPKNG